MPKARENVLELKSSYGENLTKDGWYSAELKAAMIVRMKPKKLREWSTIKLVSGSPINKRFNDLKLEDLVWCYDSTALDVFLSRQGRVLSHRRGASRSTIDRDQENSQVFVHLTFSVHAGLSDRQALQ